MSKGVKKTVLQKQIQTYNEFQYIIRQADRLGLSKPLPVTPAELIAHAIEVAKIDKARLDKAKLIKDYLATKPQNGNTRGLTIERVQEMAKESREWTTGYHKFLKTIKNL